MRIIFMGTPEFALPSLSILAEEHHDIAAVVTVPDKPQGRGQHILFSPIKDFALKNNFSILQPEKLTDAQFISNISTLHPDLIIVVAFRILPKEIFSIPKFGAINLHASLLPKYRGAAPINWAIINGEKETGVTTFFLQEKVDTGNILLQAKIKIRENDTAGEIHDTLADIGAEIVLHTVNLIAERKAHPTQQDEKLATPAPKIFRHHCKIDWNNSASSIHNFIRGLSPHPGAFTFYKNTQLKILRTEIIDSILIGQPGTIIECEKNLCISTSDGTIKILEIQKEGKKKMFVEEFLRGFHIKINDTFS